MGLALRREWEPAPERNPEVEPSSPRKPRWPRWLAAGLLIFLLVTVIAVGIAARHAEPFLRALIVERLAERFHARVELDSFHISVANGLWAQGGGLRIWPPAQIEGMAVSATNRTPLIALAEFRFHAPLHYSRTKPVHIDRIELRGLNISIPPRPRFTHAPDPPEKRSPAAPPGADLVRFQIGSVLCTDAKLTLETSNPLKIPLVFDIKTISLAHITEQGAMDFDALLTNPRPRGLINSHGKLGPWIVADPGETPVSGVYRLDHADLGVFRGIAGILQSTGSYTGTLRNMTVDGQTETPDFSLDRFGAPMPLHTDFHARVDGTNGDTFLEPVNATLGKSHFTARGKIAQVTQRESIDGPVHSLGHDIALDVHIDGGQIGDFLQLTSSTGDPLLNGSLDLRTTFELPHGPEPVQRRMRLKGRFLLDDARFTSAKIQERIGALSMRGQGRPQDAKSDAVSSVRSTMTGDFTMAAGKIHLPNLVYIIPGAEIDLHGEYGVEHGSLDFKGKARMSATISQMVGGWKGTLLKPVDRLFKKDGAGTRIGVHINGNREDPQFGVDL